MGLFSFLKKAGSRLFSKNESEREKTTTSGLNDMVEHNQRLILLKGVINSLNVPVENLSLDLEDDKVTVYGQTDTYANKEKIVLAAGNVSGIATVDDRLSVSASVGEEEEEKAVEATFYTVKKGDSLSKIAINHYGDWKKYKGIFAANQPMLKDPDLIYPGQVLRLPPEDQLQA
ncbi:MAG: peptidoglycan-binding protein LysM [Saprospiraceae bacterium]